MSEYIKITCGVSLSFQGCDVVNTYETDITTKEWEEMDQDQRDTVIQEYLDNHMDNYLDYWAGVAEP